MALLRCIDQASQTFRETFQRLSEANELLRARSFDMMKLIEYLTALFKNMDVYAFTTHGDLRFVSGVNTNDPICLSISSYGYGYGYTVRYVMPKEDNPPWEGAMITGEALGSQKKVARMILEAMIRSGGWKDKGDKLRTLQADLD
ncbi:MAG: hypothetical protein AAFN81_20290 [Bacteroidota bacterium]